ncbi:TetR/AcrR family transcriptional regulator [Oscillospiraceae bacterium CM]|nr:TetR/AcrR family transcriptional regulator [Oscillospiraceae bacterium CM]
MKHKNSKKSIIEKNAIQLFYDLGYSDCTLRKLASASGVTHSTILKHFNSKSECADLLVNKYHNSLIELVKAFSGAHDIFIDARTDKVLFYWCLHHRYIITDDKFRKFFTEYYKGDYRPFVQVHYQLTEKIFEELYDVQFDEPEYLKDIMIYALAAAELELVFLLDDGQIYYKEANRLLIEFFSRVFRFISVSENDFYAFIDRFGDRLDASLSHITACLAADE